MARIELSGLAHSYAKRPRRPGDWALKPMDHVWEDGRAYALLGPSGCGKTTLLNVISGLLRPTEGRVLFDDVDVTGVPTEQRNIAQVFQFPVVYDTMTVFDNLAFPLRNRKVSETTIRGRVEDVARILDLDGVLGQRAGSLAADARQKISLGRGLVRTDVSAILFDEPLTVIDPHLKNSLRRKLQEIHRRSELTLVYVTHDQTEALTFADRVVVMHDGEVVQVGTPQALFERPTHTFVGHFVGSPGMNFLTCEVDGPFAVVDGHAIRFAQRPNNVSGGCGGNLQIGVRPEYLELAWDGGDDGVPATVTGVQDLGSSKIVTVVAAGHTLKVRVAEEEEVRGETGRVLFPPERTLLYNDSKLVSAHRGGGP